MLSVQLTDTGNTLSEERCVLYVPPFFSVFGAVGPDIFTPVLFLWFPQVSHKTITLSSLSPRPSFVCHVCCLSVPCGFHLKFFFSLSFHHVCGPRTLSGIISCRDTRRRCMKAKAPLRSCQIIFSNSLFLLSQQVIPAEVKWNVCVREHLAAVGVGVWASSVSLPSLC